MYLKERRSLISVAFISRDFIVRLTLSISCWLLVSRSEERSFGSTRPALFFPRVQLAESQSLGGLQR